MAKRRSVLILLLTLISLSMPLNSNAQQASNKIQLRLQRNKASGDNRHRLPMNIDIDVYYDSNESKIYVTCAGDLEGTVFIYSDDTIVGYSPELNSAIHIPPTQSLYKIVIVGETWTAEGYLDTSDF